MAITIDYRDPRASISCPGFYGCYEIKQGTGVQHEMVMNATYFRYPEGVEPPNQNHADTVYRGYYSSYPIEKAWWQIDGKHQEPMVPNGHDAEKRAQLVSEIDRQKNQPRFVLIKFIDAEGKLMEDSNRLLQELSAKVGIKVAEQTRFYSRANEVVAAQLAKSNQCDGQQQESNAK